MKNFQPNFSHIYIERNAMDYPLAQIALSKFPKAKFVEIEHYKDIFNRSKRIFTHLRKTKTAFSNPKIIHEIDFGKKDSPIFISSI